MDGWTGKVVLVVDDDRAWREVVIALLELEGIRGVGAADGAAALSRLRRRRPLPDAVVSDLSMPVMDGRRLRDEMLREPALAGIPVVVVSGEELGRTPAARYLRKPCTPEELIAAVQELTSRREAA
jgi:CheY-like chemotaxis protein